MILVVHRSERMVRRVPAVLFLIPFEHREVHHPQELEILPVQQLVAVVVFLRGVQAQLPASHAERFPRGAALSVRRPIRPGAVNPLPRAAYACEPRPSPPENRDPGASRRHRRADRARSRRPSGRRAPCAKARRSSESRWPPEEAFRRQPLPGEQILDAMKRRNPQIRFVAAVAAHRLRVGQPRELRGHA